MAYGYAMLRGRRGAAGHVREDGGKRTVCLRGMEPGEWCRVYTLNGQQADLRDEGRADDTGKAQFSFGGRGAVFVLAEGKVRLWEDKEETYLRASSWLESLRKAKEALKEESKGEERAADKEAPLFKEDKPEEAKDPEEKEAEKEAEKIPQPEEAYFLRPAGEGEAADALPDLIWPEAAKAVKRYFELYPPFAPFAAPGWRFARIPADGPDIPFCAVGYRAQDSRVRQIAYAVPGAKGRPAALPGAYRFYPGQDGRDYWVMTQEV